MTNDKPDQSKTFLDFFTKQSKSYAQFRPRYPDGLFEWIKRVVPARDTAWDCATGNGQAAVALAEFFSHVHGTDGSGAQVAQGIPHPRVEYREALAQVSGLADHSVDLVTVAQALHWFAGEDFYREVRRVTRSGGLLIAWCYGFHRPMGHGLDPAIDHFSHEVLKPYWPENNRLIWNGYRDIPFPFEKLQTPSLLLESQPNLFEYVGFIESWSAVAKLRDAEGAAALELFCETLRDNWGDPEKKRPVVWDLSIVAGQV